MLKNYQNSLESYFLACPVYIYSQHQASLQTTHTHEAVNNLMIESSIIPFKHAVESGNFIDSHFRHTQHVSDIMHCWNWKPSCQYNTLLIYLIRKPASIYIVLLMCDTTPYWYISQTSLHITTLVLLLCDITPDWYIS